MRTMSPIQQKFWEMFYPGCKDDFERALGTKEPSYTHVAEWKEKWVKDSPHKLLLAGIESWSSDNLRLKVADVCRHCNIHPYFWDYDVITQDFTDKFGDIDFSRIPVVIFFEEEHLVMFKLHWGS